MTPHEQQHLLSFLGNCSPVSLGNFLLAKQNRAANLERDLRDLVQELCENLVFIELACLLRNNGREVRTLEMRQGAADLSTSPTMVPPDGYHWICDRRDLSHCEWSVLISIKRFCNRNHCARVTVRRLAECCRLSLRAVTAALASLRKKGFLQSEYTGRADFFQVLEPPPELFSGTHLVRTSKAPEAHQLSMGCAPEPSGTHQVRTLSVNHRNVPLVSAGRSNGGPGEIGVSAVTPKAARPDVSDRELKKLQLEAEILGRTERLQKKALTSEDWKIGRGPQATREPNAAGMRHINAVRARPHNNLPPIYTEEQIRQAEAAERISSPVKAEKIQKRELAKKAGAP